jgi:hypothetical protein
MDKLVAYLVNVMGMAPDQATRMAMTLFGNNPPQPQQTGAPRPVDQVYQRDAQNLQLAKQGNPYDSAYRPGPRVTVNAQPAQMQPRQPIPVTVDGTPVDQYLESQSFDHPWTRSPEWKAKIEQQRREYQMKQGGKSTGGGRGGGFNRGTHKPALVHQAVVSHLKDKYGLKDKDAAELATSIVVPYGSGYSGSGNHEMPSSEAGGE